MAAGLVIAMVALSAGVATAHEAPLFSGQCHTSGDCPALQICKDGFCSRCGDDHSRVCSGRTHECIPGLGVDKLNPVGSIGISGNVSEPESIGDGFCRKRCKQTSECVVAIGEVCSEGFCNYCSYAGELPCDGDKPCRAMDAELVVDEESGKEVCDPENQDYDFEIAPGFAPEAAAPGPGFFGDYGSCSSDDDCNDRQSCQFGFCSGCGGEFQSPCNDGNPCDDGFVEGVSSFSLQFEDYDGSPSCQRACEQDSDCNDNNFEACTKGVCLFCGSPGDPVCPGDVPCVVANSDQIPAPADSSVTICDPAASFDFYGGPAPGPAPHFHHSHPHTGRHSHDGESGAYGGEDTGKPGDRHVHFDDYVSFFDFGAPAPAPF